VEGETGEGEGGGRDRRTLDTLLGEFHRQYAEISRAWRVCVGRVAGPQMADDRKPDKFVNNLFSGTGKETPDEVVETKRNRCTHGTAVEERELRRCAERLSNHERVTTQNHV